MVSASHMNRFFSNSLLVIGSLLITIAVLPLLGLFAFISRPLAILLLFIGLPAVLFSRRFREWFGFEEMSPDYHHGVRVPGGALLHPTHSWAKPVGSGQALVGVDDLMQKALGRADQVLLPPLGLLVEQGDVLFRIRRGNRRVDVRSPVAGRVFECNDALLRNPKLLNSSPYSDGWAVQLHDVDLRADCRALRRGSQGRSWFREEVDQLLAVVAPAGPYAAAADGGVVVDDFHAAIDEPTWQRIRDTFFGGQEVEAGEEAR